MSWGGATTLNEQALAPWHKMAVGYGVSIAAIAYGLLRRENRNLFAQTMLGSGMAALYFTTYAGFFIDSVPVFGDLAWAVPVLLGVLVLIGWIAHYRKSETAAGLALFLIFYTVVLSLRDGGTGEDAFYALFTCSVVSVMALVFHFMHRWLFFTWAALIASQLTYIFFFLVNPAVLNISEQGAFWLSNGFLSITWVVFSVACVTDARKTGEFRRTVASMSGVNSFVFFTLTWVSIRTHYVEYEWAFRLGFAAALGIFAVYAHLSGPRRNYLYQIFLAKMVVMFTLALQAYLSHEWLLVALALESLGLGFSYKRSGLVIFKMMGLGLLFVTFVGCIFSVRIPGEVVLGGYAVPARWFACVGAPAVLTLVAWFYNRFVTRVEPEERVTKGQRFLADTIWDTSSAATSLLYAAASSLILMAITIIDLGDSPALPYVLAGEGVLMALVGLLLRTSQVEVASVLLLVASHVTYHVFLFVDKPGFETQDSYALYTILVAMLTLFGGYLWERYLRHVRGGTALEHNALASVPYVAAVLMLGTLMQRELPGVMVPLGENALGVALIAAWAITLLTGMKTAGILALVMGTFSFYGGLFDFGSPLAEEGDFFGPFVLFVAAYVTAERVIAMSTSPEFPESVGDKGLRTGIVAVAGLLGVLGLSQWAAEDYLSISLMGLALVAMVAGLALRESRYRWAALAVYLVAIGRAYLYDLTNLDPLPRFMSFAALCVPLLVISWGYSVYRARHLRSIRAERVDEASPDG